MTYGSESECATLYSTVPTWNKKFFHVSRFKFLVLSFMFYFKLCFAWNSDFRQHLYGYLRNMSAVEIDYAYFCETIKNTILI